MNTVRLSEYLAQVSGTLPNDLMVMVVDSASSHKAKDLGVPENIRLLRLHSYSPQLNPQEHIWDELRGKEFLNQVYDPLDAVIGQYEQSWPHQAQDHHRL